jgi:hypothetical protein
VSQPSLTGAPPLNGIPPEGKNSLRLHIEGQWDKINHPTLVNLMRMILRHAEAHGWEALILWKKDLQGAFTLLWFRPCDVPLLAFQLTDDQMAFHLAGMFGWVGMPFIFQVVTRMLTALVAFVILGLCIMYVDDLLAVSTHLTAARDMSQADEAITLLLGDKAVAKHKDESGRALDWIGWHIDLDNQSVTISRRNLMKTIYVFFCFHIDDSMQSTVQGNAPIHKGTLRSSEALHGYVHISSPVILGKGGCVCVEGLPDFIQVRPCGLVSPYTIVRSSSGFGGRCLPY